MWEKAFNAVVVCCYIQKGFEATLRAYRCMLISNLFHSQERTYGAGNEHINEIFEVLCTHALTAAMCTLQSAYDFACIEIGFQHTKFKFHGDKLSMHGLCPRPFFMADTGSDRHLD